MSVDLKLVLLGHKNVGKTSVFNRYVYDEYGKTSMTIGAYFGMKQCRVNDKTVHQISVFSPPLEVHCINSYFCENQVNLAIWDTAGEEKFDSLTNFYCRNAKAALICYDITNEETFRGLQRWVDKITLEADQNCALIIVGNKLDAAQENPSARQVDLNEAKRYAASIGAQVVEASAKTGENVPQTFFNVVQMAFDRHGTGLKQGGKRGVDLDGKSKDDEGSKCCG